jgi:apolipoprotein D and lipocalin family protein
MRKRNYTLICIIILILSSCQIKSQEMKVLQNIDLIRYIGKWYEIASLSGRFQKGCQCTTAEYDLIVGKNYLQVKNRCFRKGKWSEITGKAFFSPGSTEGKLKVQFFWPFRSDYYIIDLAPDYAWAVVSVPNYKYLWIFCRKPQMDNNLFEEILQKLRQKGFNTKLLQITKQDCKDA